MISSQHPLPLARRLKRRWVRVKASRFTVPIGLLFLYGLVILGLSRVADAWIVLLAATPLAFAALMALGCLWLYRRDFYA